MVFLTNARAMSRYGAPVSRKRIESSVIRCATCAHVAVVLLINVLFWTSGTNGSDSTIINEADLRALQGLKSALVDQRGVLSSWNHSSSRDACFGGWTGITCDNGVVTAIQIPFKGLGGRIPEEVGALKGLRRLSLHDNLITGVIPSSLGSLPRLRGLFLFNNRFAGSVPPSIGNCSQLRNLDLSNNYLTGVIPPSLVSSSSRIYRLNLSFNSLHGSIPESFTRSSSLTLLALQHNNLSGPIPSTWGSETGKINLEYELRVMTLDHNRLSGSIPPALGKLDKLEFLSLSRNEINGVIPGFQGSLPALQTLDLSRNVINGSLPDTLCDLKNLSVLDLNGNQFTGPIPSCVGSMLSVISLDLSENSFTGEIPVSLSDLSNLRFFNVSYNNLSGTVPGRLSQRFNQASFVGNPKLCGYSPSTPCPSSEGPSGSGHHKKGFKMTPKVIALINVGGLLAILLLVCCILFCYLICQRAGHKGGEGKAKEAPKTASSSAGAGAGAAAEGGKLVLFDGPVVFNVEDLLCAVAEVMGKSAYGTTYKATMENGITVTVKRLNAKLAKALKEFDVEIATLGRIRHPNLLPVRAYYIGSMGEKLLVLDYVPNGTLSSFLHGEAPGVKTPIDWPTRLKIAIGITRGLEHLHSQQNVVHGNLTSSKIYMDQDLVPKIADFGMLRLMKTDAANAISPSDSSAAAYRAPEIQKPGTKTPTNKADIFSLGVIILELLTGKSPSETVEGMDLPQWVSATVREQWTNEVFDVALMRDGSEVIEGEMVNTLKLALLLVHPLPDARPDVDYVLRQLEEIDPSLAPAASVTAIRGVSSEMTMPQILYGLVYVCLSCTFFFALYRALHPISYLIYLKYKLRRNEGHFGEELLGMHPKGIKGSDSKVINEADLRALLALKSELVDPRGVLGSWNHSSWKGACSGGWIGIACTNGMVTTIQLPFKGLGGRISEEIGFLQGLRRLSLHGNFITGVIPSSLGSLSKLRGLYLFNNRLTGTIPPSIGYCPRLRSVDLSNNFLTGFIPSGLASSLRIYRLNLSFNLFYGSIPDSFTRSSSLSLLALQHNNLSGPVPNTWGSETGKNNLDYQLRLLTLDHNRLSGSIPSALGKLSRLELLSLSDNQISGDIPRFQGSLPKLQSLDLSKNAINGTFPVAFCNMKNISVLDLKGNKLSASIPSCVGSMLSIVSLDLSDNSFSGAIPASISSLSNLRFLNVSYNDLSGTVPYRLSQKFNPISFVGNLKLCGYSPLSPCPSSAGMAVLGQHDKGRQMSPKDVILINVGGLLAILLLLCCILFCFLICQRAGQKWGSQAKEAPRMTSSGAPAGGGKLVLFDGPVVFSAEDLLCAGAEVMGKSAYGTMYKATLGSGTTVAVKRLNEKLAKTPKEFEVEVAAIGRISHRNLLSIRAYYIGSMGEKLLVLDYMPKGNLSSFLHGDAHGVRRLIDWPTRLKIAIGITRGLEHLHTWENVIHGNLTSSEIYMDNDIVPKVADYSMLRLMNADAANTISTSGSCTAGYRAPEIQKLGTRMMTNKADIYSLGVIILELLTGKSPGETIDRMDLPQWVLATVREQWTNEVFDWELLRDGSMVVEEEMVSTLKLALLMVHPSADARPDVEYVLRQLEEIDPSLFC
ncbi:hypothetical protein Drorol1_Dr00026041 [Drosera rotundifolia]